MFGQCGNPQERNLIGIIGYLQRQAGRRRAARCERTGLMTTTIAVIGVGTPLAVLTQREVGEFIIDLAGDAVEIARTR